MKYSNRANILLFPMAVAVAMPAAANDASSTVKPKRAEQTTAVTVNGFSSWEEAYAAEAKRLAAMGLK